MVSLILLGKKVFQKSFADYPWYEMLLVFLTEFVPVLIILYGLYIQVRISRIDINSSDIRSLSKSQHLSDGTQPS